MSTATSKRIAVLGAGPIGLEAALYARTLGHPTTVYEAGSPGHHVLAWGHVRLFTPWALNVSPLGARRLRETGHSALHRRPEAFPTGAEFVREYLDPLARLPELEGTIQSGSRVTAVSRQGMHKGDGIGDGSRSKTPFRLLVHTAGGEAIEEADVVLDATGVFANPNPLGRGGMPAPGERDLADLIETGLPDVAGRDRAGFEGKRVLVVGGGMSAATTVAGLCRLAGTTAHWATLAGVPPVAEVPDDPLPARLSLAREANRLAREGVGACIHHPESSVEALARRPGGAVVRLHGTGGETVIEVDRIVNQTGFRPDPALHRELQIHLCYASEGPMKLAAALLGSAGGDCMQQTGFGADSLTSPEPDFFLIGHKSYGRGSQFLLRIGREQVRDVFRLVGGDRSLDLYAPESAHV